MPPDHQDRPVGGQRQQDRRPDYDERRALAWLERASLPVSALNDGAVVSDMLDAIATRLDGGAAAPDYFARRRRVMHRVLAYAVRKKRLNKNPLSKGNLPEGWTTPEKPEEAIDPRAVGSPELIADMLTVTSYVGRRQGPRFVAFFGCMFYAMMRPAEVTSLTEDGCHLPEHGWGRLIFADSSPAAGREFTDNGQVHKDRGLKGRDRQGHAPSGRWRRFGRAAAAVPASRRAPGVGRRQLAASLQVAPQSLPLVQAQAAPDAGWLVGDYRIRQALVLDGASAADSLGWGAETVGGREEEVGVGAVAQGLGRPCPARVGVCRRELAGC